MGELIHYDAAMRELAAARDVDEAAELRNKASALEAYARQARNTDAERMACEIRLRAERKVGALLAEKERKQGSGGINQHSAQAEPKAKSEYQQAKKQAGISDTQAKRWQALAKVSDDDFEAALEAPPKPTTTGILKRNKDAKAMDPRALWLWGRLRDFEKEHIAEYEPSSLMGELTETMAADVRRIAPIMAAYLELFTEI